MRLAPLRARLFYCVILSEGERPSRRISECNLEPIFAFVVFSEGFASPNMITRQHRGPSTRAFALAQDDRRRWFEIAQSRNHAIARFIYHPLP